MEMTTEQIDWPVLFGATADLGGLEWKEERPGCWRAPYGDAADGLAMLAVVTPTERLWYAQLVSLVAVEGHLAQVWFVQHDTLAGRLRERGWEVGCSGPDCRYRWPCPKREMHDFAGQPNGGELHTPIGTQKP